jgi:3'-5' exoribonuclease
MSHQPTLPTDSGKRFVAELSVGERVRSIFLLTRCDVRTRQSGDAYLVLELSDKSGRIGGRMWDNAEETIAEVGAGDYVWVEGVVDTWQSEAQLKVDRMSAAEEEVDPRDFLPAAAIDPDEMYRELLELVATVTNPHLRNLLEKTFADPDVARRFRRAPGGIKLHHAYVGGLLEHTLSVVRLADRVTAHYDELDRDLLLTGAFLHDIGKIWELSYERAFDYTDEGRLVGHLLLETEWLSKRIDEIDDFPPSMRTHLMHLLASHHGQYEHGAPVAPARPEALALHYVDDLDSKMAAMEMAIKEAAASGAAAAYSPSLGRRIVRRAWNEPDD